MQTINFFSSSARGLIPVVVLAMLSGCIHGTYQDPSEPDVAKLRFISELQSATLDYFDADNCTGLTTGIMNNWLVVDTKRRVGMKVPAPVGADDYQEINLKPGREVMLRTNTNSGYGVCGVGFYLLPEANTEYEVEFTTQGSYCLVNLSRLHSVDGKGQRERMPLNKAGLAACVGKTPLLPRSADLDWMRGTPPPQQ